MNNQSNPRVSIVMPTFNYGHFISEAIGSVLSQTFRDFELIIVDNFSSDNTTEVVSSFQDERIRFHQFDNRGSIAAARNFGWKKARGELIAFLDSDDKFGETKLETQLTVHADENVLSHHDLRLFGTKRIGVAKGRRVGDHATLDLITRGNPINTSSTMISRHLLELSGGFSEDQEIVTAEDFHLWLKLSEHGANIVYLPKVLGFYRLHSASTSSGKSVAAAIKVLAKYKNTLTSSEARLMEGWVSYAQAGLTPDKEMRRKLLARAAREASFHFRWRALLRLLFGF